MDNADIHRRLADVVHKRLEDLMSNPQELKRIQDEIHRSAQEYNLGLRRSGGVILPKY